MHLRHRGIGPTGGLLGNYNELLASMKDRQKLFPVDIVNSGDHLYCLLTVLNSVDVI